MKKISTMIFAVLFTANLMAQVPNYVPTNGLVAWYPFTGNANDESGNGNNGTVNGATLTTDRFGNANKAYDFDGNNDYVQIANNATLEPNSSISISAWASIDPSQTTGFPPIISKEAGLNAGYTSYALIGGNPGLNQLGDIGLQITTNNGGYQWTGVTGTSFLNQWVFVTGIYDGSNMKIYHNGSLTTIIPKTGNIQYQNYLLTIARSMANSTSTYSFFKGKIDDIGIWNRALTQQEITALYNACLNNTTNITPQNNQVNIGNTATFTANTSATSPSYIWQSDLGQGFQTLNSVGKYSGTSTNNLSISNVQLTNHLDPIRAIITYGSCKDTSNIAYIKITDTCITKINDTIKITKYDTITTKITKYDTIKVMDTLVINANLSGISAPNNTNRIIVYPNPAKDHITIDYGVFSRMSGYTVKITNTIGQTVFSSPINQQSSFINLSSWTGKGVYYLQIIDKQNSIIENRKIILQ
jgi:hypothetical protein